MHPHEPFRQGQAHFTPQPPQLFASLSVETQVPAQSVVPAGHWQPPVTQTLPTEHVAPQAPQFFASVSKSTQPTQQVLPGAQAHGTQLPATHIWPSGQAAPHAPQ